MKRRFTVTKEDCLKGVPNNLSRCPVALGIARHLPEDIFAIVGVREIVFHSKGPRGFVPRITIPSRAIREFIKTFDSCAEHRNLIVHDLEYDPLWFTIDVDEEVGWIEKEKEK